MANITMPPPINTASSHSIFVVIAAFLMCLLSCLPDPAVAANSGSHLIGRGHLAFCTHVQPHRNHCIQPKQQTWSLQQAPLHIPTLAHRQNSEQESKMSRKSNKKFASTMVMNSKSDVTSLPTEGNGNRQYKTKEQQQSEDRISSIVLFVITPLLSLLLPLMLDLGLYGPLSIAKRTVIYMAAGTIASIAAVRGSNDDARLGKRLEALTSEILPKSLLTNVDNDEEKEEDDTTKIPDEKNKKKDERFRELRALDDVGVETQSVALPIIVSSSLALSFFLIQLQNSDGTSSLLAAADFFSSSPFGENIFLSELASTISSWTTNVIEQFESTVIPSFVVLSNAAVLGLFVRAELDRSFRAWWTIGSKDGNGVNDDSTPSSTITPSSSPPPAVLSTALAALLISVAYLAPPSIAWPIRNAVCMCLGVGVSRAIQLPRLGPTIAALTALVLYDVYSVGIMLVNLGSASLAAKSAAAVTATATATASSAVGTATTSTAAGAAATSSSAMKTAALSKVGGVGGTAASPATPAWQPGLLEVRLRGRVTDLLGLGDAVFPSILATFALRYDTQSDNQTILPSEDIDEKQQIVNQPPAYFAASLVGFTGGCTLCEFAPGISSSGLPALLFIVPSMLVAVFGLAAIKGDLGRMWEFNPAEETKI